MKLLYICSKMRILNKEVLDELMGKHADAIAPVNRWIEIVENNDFKNHNELKSLFPSADYVGNGRYVFNIGESISVPCADSFYQWDNADQVLRNPRRVR